MATSTEERKAAKDRVFYWLLLGTIVYFVVYGLLMLETKRCDPFQEYFPVSKNSFWGFWDIYLGCRQINELGDALAGAFAPVAFLWLAGTVFIQSKELAAQRDEMNETQEVMEAQLQVAKEQVEETRASKELAEQQTNILRRQQEIKEQQLADAEFDEKVENLKTQALRTNTIAEAVPIVEIIRDNGPNYAAQLSFPASSNVPELSDSIRQGADQLREWIMDWEASYGTLKTKPSDGYRKLSDIITDIAFYRPKLSAAYRVKFDSYAFHALGASFVTLNEKLAQNAEKPSEEQH